MPATALCPTCRLSFPLPAGARVECPGCFETFDPRAAPKPARDHAPIPLAEMVEDDDIPVVQPVATTATPTRPVATVVAPPVPVATLTPPAEPEPRDRKTVGTPKARKATKDDPPAKPAATSGWRVIAAGVLGLLLLIGAAVGTISATRPAKKAVETVAAVPPVEAPPEPDRPPPVVVPPPEFPPEPPPPPEPPKPAPGPSVVPPARVVEITPTAAADGMVIELSSPVDRICVGGGGRFLVFRMPKSGQIAVFDASAGRVVKLLPLAEPGGLIAAGMSKLFVVLPNANAIERWDLRTFKHETTAPNPHGHAVSLALMGHASDGPLFVAGDRVGPNGSRGLGFIDAQTLTALSRSSAGGLLGAFAPVGRVSADGRVYCWEAQGGAGGLSSLVLGNGDGKTASRSVNAAPVMPGPDGTVFTCLGPYTAELDPIGPRKPHSVWGCEIPAAHGPFTLTVTGGEYVRAKQTETPRGLALTTGGEPVPIPGVPDLFPRDGPFVPGVPHPWDRVHLIPAAKLLAVLDSSGVKLHLFAVDVKAKLDAAGADYLFVVSRPHAATAGKNYRYTPDVWSKRGGAKVKLGSGPDGMKVVGNSVTWAVPADAPDTVRVELTVADESGREATHGFYLTVRPK